MNTFNQTSSNSNSKNIAGNQQQSVRMALLEGIKKAKSLMQSEKSGNDSSLNALIKEFEARLNEGDSAVESDSTDKFSMSGTSQSKATGSATGDAESDSIGNSSENKRDFSADVDVSNSGKGIKQKNQGQYDANKQDPQQDQHTKKAV